MSDDTIIIAGIAIALVAYLTYTTSKANQVAANNAPDTGIWGILDDIGFG